MLKEVFGVRTKSKHDDGRSESWRELVGQDPLGTPWQDALPRLKESQDEHLVKTHDGPETNDKCIYVVREPCAAVVSYWHFLRDIQGVSVPVVAVAAGLCQYGSWSDHVRLWDPLRRRDTLLIRFEDLVASPSRMIAALGEFLVRDPVGSWDGDIARLRAVDPTFFRSGSNAVNHLEMPSGVRRVLESICGREMIEVGYDVGQALAEDSQVMGTLIDAAREAVDHWRAVAIERQSVIDGLEATCRKRQEVIDLLDAECRERQLIIDRLDIECRRQQEAETSLNPGSGSPSPKSI